MSAHPASNPTKPNKPLVAIDLNSPPAIEQAIEQAIEHPIDQIVDHITIRWDISRNALGSHAPTGTSQIVQLELKITPNQSTTQPASLTLIDPITKTPRSIDLPELTQPITLSTSNSMLILQSPHLRAYIKPTTTDSPELIYIHTDVFAALNIPGGRFSPTGCSIRYK
ncbi:MAG: hypothetical protein JKX70_09830 [Phycisphaerales bacterium]|nr:hypothetical protein [Phycisphaerales bacterium]